MENLTFRLPVVHFCSLPLSDHVLRACGGYTVGNIKIRMSESRGLRGLEVRGAGGVAVGCSRTGMSLTVIWIKRDRSVDVRDPNDLCLSEVGPMDEALFTCSMNHDGEGLPAICCLDQLTDKVRRH